MPVTILTNHLILDQIARSGQCFSWLSLGNGQYGIPSSGQYVQASQQGAFLTLSCTQKEFDRYWRQYFDLDTDYGDFVRRIQPNDPGLKQAAQYGEGIRILRQDLWEVMVSFLVSQNNNIPRITGCLYRLRQAYGRPLPSAPDGLHTFPLPDELAAASAEEFVALGLGYRAKYLWKLVDQMKGGGLASFAALLDSLDDNGAREALLSLYGVGKKVADCIGLFGLHRLDMFPVDTHIMNVLSQQYPDGFPQEAYRGCRGVMQQYWFFYDLMTNSPPHSRSNSVHKKAE